MMPSGCRGLGAAEPQNAPIFTLCVSLKLTLYLFGLFVNLFVWPAPLEASRRREECWRNEEREAKVKTVLSVNEAEFRGRQYKHSCGAVAYLAIKLNTIHLKTVSFE
jgi:hypothetical protein